MIKKSFHYRFFGLGLLLLFLSLNACKKGKRYQPEQLASNPNIPSEVAFIEVAKQIFGNEFKEGKIEKEKEGYHVSIEFGGKTALTFLTEGKYEKELKLVTALYAVKYFRYMEQRNLESLTLSLVKPYYIHHEEINQEVIQDFEVFRVRLEKNDMEKVQGWKEIPLEFSKEKAEVKEEVLKVLENINLLWKIELDEFKRVELK